MTWLVLLLALVGCGGGDPSSDPPAELPTSAPEVLPVPRRVEPGAVVPEPAPASGGGDLPPECLAFKELVDKLAECDKLGDQRDLLKSQFNRSWRAWNELAADQRKDLAGKCTTSATHLRSAVAAACSW